ncbi:MAG: SurA N-terminal domain-containing protein [Lutibacter sp.]|jgi:peptidylprolyl isomerase/peptidyl-prolyl cis-trans isomerase D|nr:SurA N-terminal domain-containing protein [Lutibacter sp.]
MAILSKIRDRSMFLILIVGMALFAFVLDPQSIQSFFSTSKINAIGNVNGEDIDREEFARQVEAYRSRSGANTTQMKAVKAVWNTMLSEQVFENQLEKAGVVVGEKDIWDAMIAIPEIQNSPLFKNELNLFDQEKLKEYVATIKADAEAGDNAAWMGWLETERNIKKNLQRQAYTTLVTAGLGTTLKEGERDYAYNSLKMDAQYVYVPYSSVPDSLITITKGDMQKYLKKNDALYKAEATRSLEFFKFEIVPSEADEAAVKSEVAAYIDDRDEYSNAAKSTITIPGLRNATDYEAFLQENKSDLSLDNAYKFKAQLPKVVADEIFDASTGEVVGPYKDAGYYKISKVVERRTLPDSVQSSHIIVPYAGATRSSSLKTKEAAKKTADSIYRLVRRSKKKFTQIADQINTDGTKGKGGDIGWIRKDQAFSPSFDKDFAAYIYMNKVGSVGVVETAFGYHVIRVEAQKNFQKAVKTVSYGRLIEASEATENTIFEEAETVASNLSDGTLLSELSATYNQQVLSAMNLKVLDEYVPSLGDQRSIVTWAFKEQTEVGDSKRFDVDVLGQRGYAVVVLTESTEGKGVSLSSDIIARVRPILVNQKKAALIKSKMEGASLEEIAQNNHTTIRKANAVTQARPLLSGVGNEPAVVGAMSAAAIGTMTGLIEGKKGVFVLSVDKREDPPALDNYDNYRNKLLGQLKSRTYQLNDVLKNSATVVDNRSRFF